MMLIFWLLFATTLVGSGALECTLHFYPSPICHHYDYSRGCEPGLEEACEPIKTTNQNPRCPVYICVSIKMFHDVFRSNAFRSKVEAPYFFCSLSVLIFSSDGGLHRNFSCQSAMCKSRTNHCLCCLDFIAELYFIQCSKANCQKKIVYPKIFEECEKCLKSCSDTRCNQQVKGLPRYWFTKPDQIIVQFGRAGPNRLIVRSTKRGNNWCLDF